MAVSKTMPAEIVQAAEEVGLRQFGENRVQEAVAKIPLCDPTSRWDLIGPLQSNKARLAVAHFSRLQTVDRPKLVNVLARLATEEGRERLPILLQVNAGDDPAKSGCTVEEAATLLELVREHPVLCPEGLMTIAPLDDDPLVARRCFARLRDLRDRLAVESGLPLGVLSMGMSGDLEDAIAEGSTLVRVGSAIFGHRD